MGIFYTAPSSNLRSVNEVYFGESKELNDITEQIGKIRAKYKYSSKYFSKVNTDPELLKLNRMFEEFFGFETFCIVLEETTQYNAYTFPVSSAIGAKTGKDAIETTKHGFRFKKKCGLNLFMVVNAGIFLGNVFSDREVLAIMLHEIGHSFSASLHPTCTFASYVYKANNLAVLIMAPIHLLIGNSQAVFSSSNAFRGWANRTAKKIKEDHPELNDMLHSIKGFAGIISDAFTNIVMGSSVAITILNPIGSFLSSVYNNIAGLFKNPMRLFQTIFGYKDEQIADNFATLYGYGPDLSTAFQKMEEEGYGIGALKMTKKMPLIGHMYDLFSLPTNMLCSLMDPHPNTAGRMDSQLKYLKTEMRNQAMDPKMKKQILEDIKKIEETIDETYHSAMSDDPDYFSKSYSAILLTLCNGDVRNVFDNPPNKQIDRIANDTKI